MDTQLPRWSPTVSFRVTPPSPVDASKNTSSLTRLSVLIRPNLLSSTSYFIAGLPCAVMSACCFTDPINCAMCTANRPCTFPLSTASPLTGGISLHARSTASWNPSTLVSEGGLFSSAQDLGCSHRVGLRPTTFVLQEVERAGLRPVPPAFWTIYKSLPRGVG